ncbi:Cd(II)/Pb(II)-responsive transcriptional regulator [Paludibacterium paludis]|uniref:Transcriptional regulator n=1 Tax=Paludibacterium paludis TaxID=1225769 RepID=A0A918U7H7_9NEIS|nr:Cd(II)/Pb(II)-responsive transcriptional regulator [Paludibacterium paludis]GGY03223.1 transcriptional regulator [Paludibacterium paludis]
MLIGELAKETGCDTETIRFYEKEGLIDAPGRSASGYRRYRPEHAGQLNFVLHCRSLGISLAEIRTLSAFRRDPTLACEDINNLIDGHIAQVHQQIETLKRLEHQLQALRQRCAEASDAGHCGILQTLVQAAQGEGCVCHQEAERHP